VAYIGRDLEDAIRLGILRRDEIPKRIATILGNTNGTIVYRLVTDIISHSYQKPHLAFSGKTSATLAELKRFNLERIYLNPTIKKNATKVKALFRLLFERYLRDLAQGNQHSPIYRGFLHNMSATYVERHSHAEIVRDFIAGMTDRYFLDQCPAAKLPKFPQVGMESESR
jgi:dGTPase